MGAAQYIKEKLFFDELTKHAKVCECKLVSFFVKNPKPTDKQFHEWAESQGYDHHKAEEAVYKLLGDLFKNLKGDAVKADSAQITKGIKEELEHTDNKLIAKKIALDHLKKDPNYYDKHKKE
jgi:hypothetical protein